MSASESHAPNGDALFSVQAAGKNGPPVQQTLGCAAPAKQGATVCPASASDATAFTVEDVALDALVVALAADGAAVGVLLQPATPALRNARAH